MEEIGAFGERIDEKLTTPAYIHIFIFNGQAHKLDEEKSKIVHYVVMIYKQQYITYAGGYQRAMWTTGKN